MRPGLRLRPLLGAPALAAAGALASASAAATAGIKGAAFTLGLLACRGLHIFGGAAELDGGSTHKLFHRAPPD